MLLVETRAGRLGHRGQSYRAAIGKGGPLPLLEKREGDGATPLGRFRLLGALLRPDRVVPPQTALPWRWLRPCDGWSDDPADPDYNRPISHPHRFSAERLWRDDHVYDVVLAISHNSEPVVPGLGSAVFLHLARPDWAPTEGCVAVAAETMLAILPHLAAGEVVEIV